MRRKESEWRVFWLAAAITIAAFFVMLTGCASGGPLEPKLTPRVIQAAEECARNNGVCFFVHVENQQWHRMEIRLNGVKLGEVEGGGGHESFPVPESLLRNGRCATVELYLIGPGTRGRSDEQCLTPGGYYTLTLDSQYHIWLTPWGGR